MRVATSQLYQTNTAAIQNQYQNVLKTQEQLTSGAKFQTAKDNPLAASLSIAIEREIQALQPFRNATSQVEQRLQRTEGAVDQVQQRLNRARELVLQSNTASQSSESLQGLATELREIRSSLGQLANQQDGQGRYLFGGTQDGSPPFVEVGGSWSYQGTTQVNRVPLGNDAAVLEGLAGSSVFQGIRTGKYGATLTPNPANTGTGQITVADFQNRTQWTNSSYTLEFQNGSFNILDSTNTLVQSVPYTPGNAVVVDGFSMAFTGTPQNGDQFSLGPSSSVDVWQIMDQAIAAVEGLSASPTGGAERSNALFATLQTMDNAQQQLIQRRSDLGARLQSIDNIRDFRETLGVQEQAQLSKLKDVDMVEAVSLLQQQLQSLEVTQKTFVQIQNLSLFRFLG